jgi:hypothetical protein
MSSQCYQVIDVLKASNGLLHAPPFQKNKILAILPFHTPPPPPLLLLLLQADSDDSYSKGLSPINAVLGSLAVPATNLLPLYGYIYSATVMSSLVQIFAKKAAKQFNSLCCTFLK